MELKEEWEKVHQPYELGYHKEHGINWCRNQWQFENFWDEIRNWTKPEGLVLDIGCGPRPPLQESVVIEPLGEKYKELTPDHWWEGVALFAQPAEEYVPDFKGKFDFIQCWNCIDHTYDYKKILDNVVEYLKEEGRFALATDFKEPNKTIGHPSFPKEEFLQEIEKRFEIIDQRDNFKEREKCFLLRKKLV